MNLKTFKKIFFKSISHAQHTIFISTECPFHTLLLTGSDIFKYTTLYYFLWLQRSIGQPLQISKNHNKKTDNQKKFS